MKSRFQRPSTQPSRYSNPLIVGTFVLTVTGLITRGIGFFYRIFLSHLFGAEGMGIYQLIAPVSAFAFSLTASGLQTAVSKLAASEPATRDYKHSYRIVLSGFLLSGLLSAGCSVFVYGRAGWIASALLLEPRCAPLLRILALSFPFGALHSIVNGYFYGIKKTKIPAVTQLTEQIVRVGSVYVIFISAAASHRTLQISAAVIGLVFGEIVSLIVSLASIYHRFYKVALPSGSAGLTPSVLLSAPVRHKTGLLNICGSLLTLAVPLSLSRIIVNLLQSVEAVYIPEALRRYGLSSQDALSIYGVLTGMALPLILFPSALIGSVCVLLLPTVSEAQAAGNKLTVKRARDKTLLYCTLFGSFCTVFFLLTSRFAGDTMFHSPLAGSFIRTLSFICPFLYLSSTMSSILNGLGKTGVTFFLNILCLSIRLVFVFFLVPVYGIRGYLWGLLCGELVITLLGLCAADYYIRRL